MLRNLWQAGDLPQHTYQQGAHTVQQRPLTSLHQALEVFLPTSQEITTQHDYKAWRQANKDWQHKLAVEFQAGTGWAHHISKPLTATTLPAVGPLGGTALSQQLAAQEAIGHQWWRVDQELPQGDFDDDHLDPAYQSLTSAAICQVARSFRNGIAQTDGWKPGHLASLSDAMLDILGLFFVLAEHVGHYPRTASYVITTFIPKADGGFRPINLLGGVSAAFQVPLRAPPELG
jgi:hypothetical protein